MVSIVTITNISSQVINVLYGEIPAAQTAQASNFAYTEAGQFAIAPGASTTIEQNRVDLGQLASFRTKGLITTQFVS